MNRFSSIFGQILHLFPRREFFEAVEATQAERGAKGFSCWEQFVAMMFCQVGQAHSLREICVGLVSCFGKAKHLGIQDAPKRSTLAYANEHRPWQLYEKLFIIFWIAANRGSSASKSSGSRTGSSVSMPR